MALPQSDWGVATEAETNKQLARGTEYVQAQMNEYWA
jgi:hypothetical protein